MSRNPAATEQSILTLDYRSLALFRVSMGLVIVLDLVSRSFDISAFYTDDGLLPRAALVQQHWYDRYTSIHMLSGDAAVQGVLFVIAGLAAVALALGYRTKLANALSFLLLLSLHNRNTMILQGGDHLLRLLCFWSLFLPLGAKYSIDSRSRPPPPGDSFTSVSSLGVLLQIAFLYAFSAVQKLVDPPWQHGTAITQALLLDDFATPFGVALLGADTPLRIITWLTLVIETVFPLMLFFPKWTGPIRMVVAFTYWLMHLGIHVVLYVGVFTPVTLMTWTVVLPGYFWNGLRSRLRRCVTAAPPAIESTAMVPESDSHAATTNRWSPVLAALLIYAFVENLTHTPGHNFSLPRPLTVLMSRAGLTQNWSMFTGLDHYERGWFIIPAQLSDGSEIDLFHSAQPLSWTRPDRPHFWISDNRWYKYYGRMDSPRYEFARPYLGRYLCDRWNRSHDPAHQLDVLYVAHVAQDPLPSERVDPAHTRILLKQECRPGAGRRHQAWLEDTQKRLLAPAPTT